MKDIFIDVNIVKNFSNPMDNAYKELIKWLEHYEEANEGEDNNAYLVLSQKLLTEYHRSVQANSHGSNIHVIIAKLTEQGRLNGITNNAIKQFKKTHFKKKIVKNLKTNNEDRDHIPAVLLSERKFCLTLDMGLKEDLETFPGFVVQVARKPEDLPYREG